MQTGPVASGETGDDKLPGYSQTGPTRPAPYYVRAGSQAGPSMLGRPPTPAHVPSRTRRRRAATAPRPRRPRRHLRAAPPAQPTDPNPGGAR